jgi:hypothetical protein
LITFPKSLSFGISLDTNEAWKAIGDGQNLFTDVAQKISDRHREIYPDYKYKPTEKRKDRERKKFQSEFAILIDIHED